MHKELKITSMQYLRNDMLPNLGFWYVIYFLAMGIISFNQILTVYFLINDYFYLENEGGDQGSIRNVLLLYGFYFGTQLFLLPLVLLFPNFQLSLYLFIKRLKMSHR